MLSNISNTKSIAKSVAKSITKSVASKKLTISYNPTVTATKEDSRLF